MKLALHGATGRMGTTLARLALAAGDSVVGAVAAASDPAVGRDYGEVAGLGHLGVAVSPDVGASLLGADVVIDFSTPSAVPEVAALAARAGVAVVSGTTGLGDGEHAALRRAAERVAVMWAPNTSLGVQVLAELVEAAVRRLGPGFDVEIVELHHRRKVDAPSGTARRLFEAARAARPELTEVNGRSGVPGARSDAEAGVLAVRGGDVIGDHTVYLLGAGERIELSHRASGRELFAHGALRAARFVAAQPAGLYSMKHVLAGGLG